MQPEQAADYVAGIFTRNEVPFATSPDGRSHRVLMGSTAIFVEVSRWGDDDSIVNLSATVLEELDEAIVPKALERLNQLNCENYFGKYCLYGTTIKAEHDLLASRLQADELVNALDAVAVQADRYDDELQKELGGKTWAQVDADARADEEALDT